MIVAAALALALQCPDGSPPPCAAARTEAPGARSVAVLNFRLLSRDTSDAYLAEGLADAITSRLSQVRRLDVASRTAARLGRQPRAAYLVSGTMLRQSSQLVVNVELLRASTGRNVWAQRYERSDTAVLGTEQDIALAVATNILPKVQPDERRALGGTPTRNPEAYDHLMRGNFLLAQRHLQSIARAIQEYEAASRLDPQLAAAPARIALACAIWRDWDWDPTGRPAPDSVLVKGVAAAARALALDSLSSDAWMAHAYMQMWTAPRTMEGVEAGFRRAIALDPRNAEAHHQLGDWLVIVLRIPEAEAEFRAALAIDPARPITLENLAAQQDSAGLPLADSGLSLAPSARSYGTRMFIRFARHDTAGARADAQRVLETVDDDERIDASGQVATLLLAMGDSASARTLVRRELDALAPNGPLGLRVMPLAGALYGLGDRATALALLQRIQPRGAIMWFGIMRGRSDLSVIPDESARRILEEARPPWVH